MYGNKTMHNYGNTGYEVLSLLKSGVAEGVTSDSHDTYSIYMNINVKMDVWK